MLRKFTIKLIFSVVIVMVIIGLVKEWDVYNMLRKKVYKQEYSEYVNKYAEKYEIDPMWIYAIIKVESNFNKDATSGSGAKGLMQLMDNTAIDLAKEVRYRKFCL